MQCNMHNLIHDLPKTRRKKPQLPTTVRGGIHAVEQPPARHFHHFNNRIFPLGNLDKTAKHYPSALLCNDRSHFRFINVFR